MADQQDQQQSPHLFKRMSLDEIIEAMTVDMESSAGHYVQSGMTPQQSASQNWGDYGGGHRQCFASNQAMGQSSGNGQSVVNPVGMPIYIPEMSSFESKRPEPMYFQPPSVYRYGMKEKNDLVGTIDVGGGNYIDVIYGNTSQIVTDPRQLNGLAPYAKQEMVDREYGLFGEQQQLPINHNNLTNKNPNGKQLIENLVGNWAPNKSGTYSPFGNSPNVTPVPQSNMMMNDLSEILPRNVIDAQQKKPRMVAEVKPMRPSYSDVLTKSAPTPISPVINNPVKPQAEAVLQKKLTSKNNKSKGKPVLLKRQNSSGSDDHGSPKIQVPKRTYDRNNANLPRRWVSLDNLASQLESQDINSFNRADDFEKKKATKASKKCEKTAETLNNSKINSNFSKSSGNTQKRPIQINNNLNTMNYFNNSLSNDNIEKNQHANNKINKEEKKTPKEKNSKRFHAEKLQQIKKGQKNRHRDHRESPVRDLYRNFNKYASRWSKFGLRMFYWLLHLISDVLSMSTNLTMQFVKCSWYYTVLHMKHSWIYVATKFSKIRFFNTCGKRIDGWFGNSKFAFWRKIKSSKEEDKEDHRSWMHGRLDVNIALPSTGEEAMKRLLACKGKDPYSILGVTPTCSDDDIKKYYKRQAFLVHPDKNSQPGAEEAFKILVHAFDIIGEPDRRKAFDQVWQVEAAWGEMSGLLKQLHRKMEQAANTIRCTNCGQRHKRIPTQRPCYAARFCAHCKIRHSAKEGDIWAESRVMGFLWHYYACMEGAVYDVTEWAACQAGNLKHLRANTHNVEYRIVSGQRPPPQNSSGGKKRQHNDPNTSDAGLEDFLNNFYNHSKSATANSTGEQTTSKSENRRRKAKRK